MNYPGTIAYRSGVGSKVDEGFCASLVAALDFLTRETGEHYHFMRGLSCMLHDSANQIAEGFLGEWVIFLDTDHVFASDALYEMIETFESEKLDILTGYTQKRRPPYTPILFKTDFDPMKPFTTVIPKGMDRHQLLPVDSAGLGCLMVRKRVFTAITVAGEKPFDMRKKFNTTDLVRQTRINSTQDMILGDRHPDETFWEDVSFYWRAKMLGFSVYCAPWIKFHHLEQRLVDETLIQENLTRDPRIPA